MIERAWSEARRLESWPPPSLSRAIAEAGSGEASPSFVARQPIYDRSLDVYAYELLFRSADTDHADVEDDEAFIAEVIRLIGLLPHHGLIIDVRSNPGGLIWAAERMLQLFTANTIVPTRFSLLPDVPTANESGLPGFESVLHYGLLAPAGTPRPIIDRLNAALRALVETKEVMQRILAEGGDPLTSTPEEYAKDIDSEETEWGALVRKLGLKPE